MAESYERLIRKNAAPASASASNPSIEGERVGTTAAAGLTVGVRVGVCVMVGVFVGVKVGVLVGVFVATPAGVFVGVLVGVFVGVEVGATPAGQRENSDVLLPGSVAVAVITVWPPEIGKVGLKVTLPLPSVVTLTKPRNVCPSPKSFGAAALQETFEKNSTRN